MAQATFTTSSLGAKAANNAADNRISSGNNNNSDDPVTKARNRRLNSVTAFATNAYGIMANNRTTQQYLSNSHLAASSTFPARLNARLAKNPWRPAPYLPVPERDLSCYYGIPPYRVPVEYDPQTTPISIEADEVTGSIDHKVSYQGNVTVTQADKLIKADSANYDGVEGEFSTKGNITMSTPEITVTSDGELHSDLTKRVTTFNNATFQLNGSVASGTSQKITYDNPTNEVRVEDLTFTTCPITSRDWYFKAGEVVIDRDESFGEAYNSVLYIKDVPVMYLPYVSFPTTNKRQSGLLYPYISLGSSNGFDYEQPIYWNIAPNYDLTFSPRIMSKRGLLLSNEFRYLPAENHYGEFNLSYMFHDKDWKLAENFDDSSRYFIRWQHESTFFNNDLSFKVDYQKVRNNDYDYLDDISAKGTNVTDDHLKQSFVTSYNVRNFTMSVEARDYQRLIPDSVIYYRPFALLPQVKAQYFDNAGPITMDMNAEFTRFSSSSDAVANQFDATRLHLEPSLSYQIFNNRGTTLDALVKGFYTYYSQDNLDNMPAYYRDSLGFQSLDSSEDRLLYLFQVSGKTTLERKIFDLRHTQTFEPEIMYQYIPYENQDNIALYDTTDRVQDYYTNFSFRRFTGNDRIADLNALSLGITSRILDPHDREILRFGVSQSYAFDKTRVTLNPNDPSDDNPRTPFSAFVNANVFNGFTVHGGFTYDNNTDELSTWNAMAQYKDESGALVQVSYRFTQNGNRSFANDVIDLKQLGVVAEVPITDKFRLFAASYQDLDQNKNIDTRVALKYEECCWSLAFVYEKYNACDWDSLDETTDHIFGIQFEFKGVGAVNVTGNTDNNYRDTHLLNYFDPINLNQQQLKPVALKQAQGLINVFTKLSFLEAKLCLF